MPKETGPPFPPGHATPLPNLRPPEFHTNIPLQVPTGPPREFQPGNPEVPPGPPGGPPGQYPSPIPGGHGGHTPLPNLRPPESYTSNPLQVPPGEVPPGNPALPPGVLPGKPVVPPGLPTGKYPNPTIPGGQGDKPNPTIPTEPTLKPREVRLDKVVIAWHRPYNGGSHTALHFTITRSDYDSCESGNLLKGPKKPMSRELQYWFVGSKCDGFRIDYPAIPTINPFFATKSRNAFIKTWLLRCVTFWMKDKQTQLVCENIEIENYKDIPKNKCKWIISPDPIPTCT